jgi:type IV pilus assembly protein PilP
MPNRFVMVFGLSLMLAIGLGGCENQKRSAKEPVITKQIGASPKPKAADPSKAPSEAVAGDPVAETPSEATVAQRPGRMPYNPVGKVDPFAPLYKEEAEKKPETVAAKPKGPERPRTPLEKLDLAQLKLTAIVTTGDEKRALVEEASGKGYVVEIGTHMGLERGAVVEIGQDRIVIEHAAEDDFGKTESRKRELKLQKPPGD